MRWDEMNMIMMSSCAIQDFAWHGEVRCQIYVVEVCNGVGKQQLHKQICRGYQLHTRARYTELAGTFSRLSFQGLRWLWLGGRTQSPLLVHVGTLWFRASHTNTHAHSHIYIYIHNFYTHWLETTGLVFLTPVSHLGTSTNIFSMQASQVTKGHSTAIRSQDLSAQMPPWSWRV